ncbi:MAG: TetR/AcrR family transcriptional regulator [Woeseia sp.]
MSEETLTSKAEARTQAQKDRILAAARTCFVKSGFHAASMATIAETAGMSPGLIYRYFENKNAIILAIIEHQLEVARNRIGQMHASEDLASGIVRSFGERERCDEKSMSAALFLEMSAEATRDPQIAAALSRFDATIRSEVASWLRRSREDGGYGLPDDITPARALMLVCLIEGLNVREAREPALDKALLKQALSETVAALVAPPR